MFKVFIIMFMFSPDPEGFDSISVEYIDDKLLRFKTKELCVSHVHDNLEVLKEFAAKEFDYNGIVKSIHCIKDNKHIGV